MKLAVLTDVHGNAPALKAVLDEIDALNVIDHIYCAGDMIGIGPYSNEVLSMLFSRPDVSMVTGNHDEAVLSLLLGETYPVSHQASKEHHHWIADHLDSAYIPMLKKLPRIIQQTTEGHSLLMTHYHIKPSKLLDSICNDPFSPIIEPTLPAIVSLYKDYKADLILFGHHHPIHYFKDERTIYLNPGSLGCSKNDSAPYAIIDMTTEHLRIHLKEATYDKASFLASYDRLQVPDREFIMKAFHGISI